MVAAPNRIELRNGNAAAFIAKDPEVFVWGPVGTGKTRTILERLWWQANQFPGTRTLFTRLDAERIRKSVLVTFERDVVPRGHPCLRGASREYRRHYHVGNGSEFIVSGAADIQELLSQEYDAIYWNEITELPTAEPYLMLHRSLRSGPLPWRQIITDANPNRPNHWMKVRCKKGLTREIVTRMEDNPYLHDGTTWTRDGLEYRNRISRAWSTNEVLRKRYLEGIWCVGSGLYIPQFDESRNCIMPPARLPNSKRRDWSRLWVPALGIYTSIKWWFGSMDFGTTAPGCFQVWGVDGEGRLFRVAEVYRTGKLKSWWAKAIMILIAEFEEPGRPFRGIAADPAEGGKGDTIDEMNIVLRAAGHRGNLMRPANNSHSVTVDLLRMGLDPRRPRMFFVKDAMRFGIDSELEDAGKPVCTEDELAELTFVDRVEKPHRAKDEDWDPLCADHGFDATRYAVDYAWRRDLSPEKDAPQAPVFAPGTWGSKLGHSELWKRRLRGENEDEW